MSPDKAGSRQSEEGLCEVHLSLKGPDQAIANQYHLEPIPFSFTLRRPGEIEAFQNLKAQELIEVLQELIDNRHVVGGRRSADVRETLSSETVMDMLNSSGVTVEQFLEGLGRYKKANGTDISQAEQRARIKDSVRNQFLTPVEHLLRLVDQRFGSQLDIWYQYSLPNFIATKKILDSTPNRAIEIIEPSGKLSGLFNADGKVEKIALLDFAEDQIPEWRFGFKELLTAPLVAAHKLLGAAMHCFKLDLKYDYSFAQPDFNPLRSREFQMVAGLAAEIDCRVDLTISRKFQPTEGSPNIFLATFHLTHNSFD